MSRAFATPEIDARMLTLRGAGKSFEAIANALGCSPTTAWKRIEELRVAGVSAAMARAIAAMAKREAAPALLPTPAQKAKLPDWRRCLGGCGRLFWSDFAGQRICPRCERRRAEIHPFTPDIY
jgi:hypothetical protein